MKRSLIRLIFSITTIIILSLTSFLPLVSLQGSLYLEVTEGESIQQAINNAPEGAAIYIRKGTYTEYPIYINKSIILLGESRDETIITGNGEATCIITIRADNVAIKNLTIRDTQQDPQGVSTAINLYNIKNATIEDCNIIKAGCGIRICNTVNSTVINNLLIENIYGIYIYQNSQSNLIIQNQIANNTHGIHIDINSKNNQIYNNNFINATREGFGVNFNQWNSTYILGGNYYWDYLGQDNYSGSNQNQLGSDGIIDKPYEGLDNYPYKNKIQSFKMKIDQLETYILISTNSTEVSPPKLNITSKTLTFKVNQTTAGYCRIIIPKKLLSAENQEWKILADEQQLSYLLFEDQKHSCLYFEYPRETSQITIIGTKVVPEYTTIFISIMLPILALLFIWLNRTRFHKV